MFVAAFAHACLYGYKVMYLTEALRETVLGGGLQRGLQTGLGMGLAVKLRSVKVQVRSGSV